jgi:hypothetical protein
VLCPQCANNQRYRLGTVCSRCRYEFALNPKQAPYCADRRFTKAIALASNGGVRSYTPAQLHGAIFRRRNRGPLRRFFVAAGSSNLGATLEAVRAWQYAGKDLGPILLRPRLTSSVRDEQWPEPDLFDYGAEGVLVVDDPILVDLLVLNHVHTTSKIAIVDGATGTPDRVVCALRPLVEARPDLPIFLLHGSRAGAGSDLERQAREMLAAADNPVTDIGLPVDASRRIVALRWARRMKNVPADLLTHQWLTDGVAAAVVNRASFVAMLDARKRGAQNDDWVPLGDPDGDFG